MSYSILAVLGAVFTALAIALNALIGIEVTQHDLEPLPIVEEMMEQEPKVIVEDEGEEPFPYDEEERKLRFFSGTVLADITSIR